MNPPIMKELDWNCIFHLHIDASLIVVGTILAQEGERGLIYPFIMQVDCLMCMINLTLYDNWKGGACYDICCQEISTLFAQQQVHVLCWS